MHKKVRVNPRGGLLVYKSMTIKELAKLYEEMILNTAYHPYKIKVEVERPKEAHKKVVRIEPQLIAMLEGLL